MNTEIEIAMGQIYRITEWAEQISWIIITSTEYSDERDSVDYAIVTAEDGRRTPYTAQHSDRHQVFINMLSSTEAERIV